MKINPILSVIVVLIVAVLLYTLRTCNVEWALASITSVVAALMLFSTMAVSITTGNNRTVLFRTTSGVLFVVTLVLNILFAICKASMPVIVIINSLSVIAWLLVLNAALRGGKK